MQWKKLVLWTVWPLAAATWVALVVLYFTNPSTAVWTGAVVAAAVMTEVAFWGTAVVLGTNLWGSRRRVFDFICSPFSTRQNG
ncbi:hypothetical protein [Gimibacter soli]|uniref:Uncharacterized protein n=1 Tax=Gimibacter soli TaxID=3024400 RepID=A0AAF0BJ66_9PROT|nr:hypothetical protein [Gimibacter soli]WCL52754.1 hypothetical protein PH603_09405 [Gimibacter soli]